MVRIIPPAMYPAYEFHDVIVGEVGGVKAELWRRFMDWRKRLLVRQLEVGLPETAFFYVHSPHTPPSRYIITFIIGEFFEVYRGLPEDIREKLKDLAEEAEQILNSLQ